jgi:multidrug efflux system outer membrane protein
VLLLVAASFGARAEVGPDYVRPTNAVPANYKSAEEFGVWKTGQPLDTVPKGPWWEIFHDEVLNGLERQAGAANQDLKAAVARVDQSRAVARITRSELMPTIDNNSSYTRQRYSPNQDPSFGNITANTFSVPLDLSYEIDIWGRVRRGFEAARADAVANLAAFYNVLLTLQAEVARNYFALRSIDAEIATVTRTIGLREEQVALVTSRYESGIGNELDIARAQTELATTQAEGASLAKRRGELENALAILVGANPSIFRLPAIDGGDGGLSWNPQPPSIPAGLPSELLERRPDVAEAERQLAAANARIGVAKAAFFPVLRLTGSGGLLSGDIETLFNWESRVWSIGPSISLPIFAGGRNKSNFERSKSVYVEAIAAYRQRVLIAFGDVEDSLAGIYHLAREAGARDRAVASAKRSAELANERYKSGISGYLDVVEAERGALVNQRLQAIVTGQRLIAAVNLVKALGGGWTEQQLTSTVSASRKAQPSARY